MYKYDLIWLVVNLYCKRIQTCCCLCRPQEMLSELFTPVETPEAPNRGFFKGLFGGGAQSLDREDLCEYWRAECRITSDFVIRRCKSTAVIYEHMKLITLFSYLWQLVKRLQARPLVAWRSTSRAQGAWRAWRVQRLGLWETWPAPG